jgi:hypothetical protein
LVPYQPHARVIVGVNPPHGTLYEPCQRTDVGTVNTNPIYLADGLGSVAALADTNQVVQTAYAYEAFRATTATGMTNKNSYQFAARLTTSSLEILARLLGTTSAICIPFIG